MTKPCIFNALRRRTYEIFTDYSGLLDDDSATLLLGVGTAELVELEPLDSFKLPFSSSSISTAWFTLSKNVLGFFSPQSMNGTLNFELAVQWSVLSST